MITGDMSIDDAKNNAKYKRKNDELIQKNKNKQTESHNGNMVLFVFTMFILVASIIVGCML